MRAPESAGPSWWPRDRFHWSGSSPSPRRDITATPEPQESDGDSTGCRTTRRTRAFDASRPVHSLFPLLITKNKGFLPVVFFFSFSEPALQSMQCATCSCRRSVLRWSLFVNRDEESRVKPRSTERHSTTCWQVALVSPPPCVLI